LALLENIQSKVWGISILGTGVIAEGLASLRQCISIILHTSLGTDPLRPLFGSRVYKYQDAPTNIAIPNIKASIIEALSIWEKRIKVLSVTHSYGETTGHLQFEITYKLVDENLIDSIIYNPGGISGTTTPVNLTLQAIFPPNIYVTRNYISFSLNNSPVLPPPPAGGFATPTDTYNWCVANWGNYGTFVLLPDRLMCYLNAGVYTQASLGIFVIEVGGGVMLRFGALIPPLGVSDTPYNIKFNPSGSGLLQSTPALLYSKEDILNYARTNWAAYGRWELEYVVNTLGDFSDDFSSDFYSLVDGYELVLYSNTQNSSTTLEVLL